MNILFYLFEHPELKILESFIREYIDLMDKIVTLEKDELDLIEEAFDKTKVEIYKGETPLMFQGMSKKDIATHFLTQKIEVLKECISKYPATLDVMKKIIIHIKHHPNEIEKLKLAFKRYDIAEMYCNYLVVIEELKNIELALKSHEKNK